MSKKIKVLSSVLAGFISLSLLSGCSGNGSKATSSKDDEIVVWSYLMDNEVAEIDKIAQEWAKENNKSVKVIKDNSDFQTFLQAANSSKGPDLIFGSTHNN